MLIIKDLQLFIFIVNNFARFRFLEMGVMWKVKTRSNEALIFWSLRRVVNIQK